MLPHARSRGLPRGHPLTRDDLDKMPADGHRHELIDGVNVESGIANGSPVLRLTKPFAVEIDPDALTID